MAVSKEITLEYSYSLSNLWGQQFRSEIKSLFLKISHYRLC